MDNDQSLLPKVKSLMDDLQVIRQILKQAIESDIARSGLTGPQISVLDVLVETDGLALKDLSQRVRLAHSTVSGIVDRLERQGLVRRAPDDHDRRFSRIYASERVKHYMENSAALHHPAILVDALQGAGPEERARVLDAVATLRHLLEIKQDEGRASEQIIGQAVTRR